MTRPCCSRPQAVYRNPLDEVLQFFEVYHDGCYKIYNLCVEPGRQYDPVKFGGRVVSYPFKDHNAPPLAMMAPFCRDVAQWLTLDPRNVAAIHCKAGKGRTGLMLTAILLHLRLYATAADALAAVATARTRDGKCVTIPSQIRCAHPQPRRVPTGARTARR